jgi:hypothetical protein
MMKRKASLLEAGLDEESAASNVEKFESLDDEAFDNMVSLLAAMKPKMPSSEDDVKEEKKEGKKKASEDLSEVLETAEPENNVDLSVGSEAESDIENTRAALVDFISNRLGKTLNK